MERIDIQNATADELAQAARRAAEVLDAGGVIVYPTDTVYGLGADATNEAAVQKVCDIKGRESNKSMLVMVRDLAALERYGILTPLARKLANTFLPGQLSLLIGAREQGLACQTIGRLGSAFRIPDHAFCNVLTGCFDAPVVTTSANISGFPQPMTLDDILASFADKQELVDLVVDAGDLPSSQPSTLVDARGEKAVILREGAVSHEALLAYL